MTHDHSHGTQTPVEPPRTSAATDPVCGMTVNPGTAAGSVTRAGTTYHFCSTHCLETFEANPAKYAGPTLANDHAHSGVATPLPLRVPVPKMVPPTEPR